MALADVEGEAVSRFVRAKVVVLQGDRGVRLASQGNLKELFEKRGLEVVFASEVEAIPADTSVVITTGTPVGRDVLARAPQLKMVACGFTGVDHIDIAACRSCGVLVCNVPNYSTDATAELAMGLILAQLRNLMQSHEAVKAGSWTCPQQDDLSTKTVGIVGVGRIGYRLAELCKAFNVKGLWGFDLAWNESQSVDVKQGYPGWSPKQAFPPDTKFTKLGGLYVDSLASLFLHSDIVCICTPLTQTSRGLVSKKLMELLRPHCLLVNVSRGGVVDEDALARLLSQGRFRAALDVFGEEPLPQSSALNKLPTGSLLMTPHIGYQSPASLDKLVDGTLKNILSFLAGFPINVVA